MPCELAAEYAPPKVVPHRAVRRRDDELPVALETIERSASPGSATAVTIIGFFLFALAWACVARIDLIATAQGRLVPTGGTRSIQPLEAGTVTAIRITDGDAVHAGDVLVEIDRDQLLRAPVDGTVQQLATLAVGGVVTPAQQLMAIVPVGTLPEAEVMVPNRDIGFVVPGQSAEIKIDAFDFTRYGLFHGEVFTVSQDAIASDKPAGGDPAKSPAVPSDASEPRGQQPVHAVRIWLDHAVLHLEDKVVSLAPGMAVTVEIKTGQRRVIEYLLSPLWRYRHEAAKER